MGIDGELVDKNLLKNGNEELFIVNNGCICCTVRGDLVSSLNNLIKLKNKFDRVIIETTGLADPGPVAQTFYTDENIKSLYQLDGIITLVDSKHISQHLDQKTNEALAQIGFADRIILNKTDLVSNNELTGLKQRLKYINKIAEIYSTTMSDAPISELLNIGGFKIDRALSVKPNFLEPEYPFEWGGVWHLSHSEKYHFQLSNSEESDVKLLIHNTEAPNKENILALAEKVFIQFSKDPICITHKQAIEKTGKLYQLKLDEENNAFSYQPETSHYLAVFTQHTPDELNLKLLDMNNNEYQPLFSHQFSAGHHHEHDDTVGSVSISLEGLLDKEKTHRWLRIFMQSKEQDIYRMKGILAFMDDKHWSIFHGVHTQLDSEPGKALKNNSPIVNRIIFIGKDLNKEYINESLKHCLYSADKNFLLLTQGKYVLRKKLLKILSSRCEKQQAQSLINELDWSNTGEKALRQSLIMLEKFPTLCTNQETLKQEWVLLTQTVVATWNAEFFEAEFHRSRTGLFEWAQRVSDTGERWARAEQQRRLLAESFEKMANQETAELRKELYQMKQNRKISTTQTIPNIPSLFKQPNSNDDTEKFRAKKLKPTK